MSQMRRLIPPAGGSNITVNGRTYLVAVGAQDVVEWDSFTLEANGWTAVAVSGTTAQRPTASLPNQNQGPIHLALGTKFFDSTVGALITWDGKNWRDEGGTVR